MKYYLVIMLTIGSITYHYANVAVERQSKTVETYSAIVDAAVRGAR